MFELEMFSPRAENIAQEAHSKYINSLSAFYLCSRAPEPEPAFPMS